MMDIDDYNSRYIEQVKRRGATKTVIAIAFRTALITTCFSSNIGGILLQNLLGQGNKGYEFFIIKVFCYSHVVFAGYFTLSCSRPV